MEKSKTLPWTTYETNFQFIEATDAHRAILKEERVVYHQVADMLICMKPLTHGDYLILEEVGCNRYAFKRFLLAEYMERNQKPKVEEKAVVVPKPKAKVEYEPEVQEILKKYGWNKPWYPSAERLGWNKEVLFSPEVMRSCVEHGLEWRLDWNYLQITCKKGVVNKDGWVMYDRSFPTHLVKLSTAMEKEVLKRDGLRWVEVEGILFTETKAYDLHVLQSFHASMKNLRQAIQEYEGEQKKKEAKAVVPVDTLLKKSNFYDVIQEQLAVNPEQTTFVFHRLSDPIQHEAFGKALTESNYKHRSFFFSGKPIVCLNSTDGEFVENWNVFTCIVLVLQMLSLFVFVLMCGVTCLAHVFSMTFKDERLLRVWFCISGGGALLCGLINAFLYLGTNLYVERRAKPLQLNVH